MTISNEWINAMWGGVLIGISVSLMLFWNGRVTGISGIAYGLLTPIRGDVAWRLYFLSGLVAGGLTLHLLKPEIFEGSIASPDSTVLVAGLMVGFGTVLGSGCTSGHGVCGISRMSPRSLLATTLFIITGMLAVLLLKKTGIIS